jgi:hypothetical protein
MTLVKKPHFILRKAQSLVWVLAKGRKQEQLKSAEIFRSIELAEV